MRSHRIAEVLLNFWQDSSGNTVAYLYEQRVVRREIVITAILGFRVSFQYLFAALGHNNTRGLATILFESCDQFVAEFRFEYARNHQDWGCVAGNFLLADRFISVKCTQGFRDIVHCKRVFHAGQHPKSVVQR